jgi:L-rhamnono-1,4-lactonase
MAPGEHIPIIDTHIHLFAQSHLPRLAWTSDLPADHILNRGHTVDVYKAATSGVSNLVGFVFLETDRKSGLSENQWDDPLQEAAFLSRIVRGKPLPDEGHEAVDSKLALGVVPWAPIPAGRDALAKYVSKIWDMYPGDYRDKVKGFRYLLQDKPRNVMLQENFIDGLVWLGEHNLSFDLGIDARSTGLFQLKEAIQMMEKLRDLRSPVEIIINHLCKPNLRLSGAEDVRSQPEFVRWKYLIEKLADHEFSYMKLSGLFSELPPQSTDGPDDIRSLVTRVRPWVEVILNSFSPNRIMFGSDWPVCNVGGPGPEQSWKHWRQLVSALLDDFDLSDAARQDIWHGTASRAYRIQLPLTGN